MYDSMEARRRRAHGQPDQRQNERHLLRRNEVEETLTQQQFSMAPQSGQQQQQQNGEGRHLLQRIEVETVQAEKTIQRLGIRPPGTNPQQFDTCYDGSCSDDPTYTTSAGLGCEAHANWMRSPPGEETKNSSCLDKWLSGFGDSDINQLCPITKDSTTLSVAICIQSYRYSEKEILDLTLNCPCTCQHSCWDYISLREKIIFSRLGGRQTVPSPLSVSTSSPTLTPSASPVSKSPTKSPTPIPPTPSPTSTPSASPVSTAPTASPITPWPTFVPTNVPTTSQPTGRPSPSPTTKQPSRAPSTRSPTDFPSPRPSMPFPIPSPADLLAGSGGEKQNSGRDETLAEEPIEVSARGFISSLISLSEGSTGEKSGLEIDNLYLLISAVLGTCIVGMLGCFAYSRVKKLLRRNKRNRNEGGDVAPAASPPSSPLPMEANNFPDVESIERHVLNNVLGELKYHIEHDEVMRRTDKKKVKAKGRGKSKNSKDHVAQKVDATHGNNNQCVLTIPIPGWCDDDAHRQHSKTKATEDDYSSSDESSSGHEEQIFAVADAADAVLQASSSFIQDVQNSFANDDDDGSALSWFSVGMSKQKKVGIKLPSRGPGTFGRKLKLQRAKPTSLQMKKSVQNEDSQSPENSRRKSVLNHYRPSVLRPPRHINSRSNGVVRGDRAYGVPPPTLEASKTWERSIDTRRPKVYSMDHTVKTKKKEALPQAEARKSHKSLFK